MARIKAVALAVASAPFSFPIWQRYAHCQLWDPCSPPQLWVAVGLCHHQAVCTTLPINFFCPMPKKSALQSAARLGDASVYRSRNPPWCAQAWMPRCLCAVACMRDSTRKLSLAQVLCGNSRVPHCAPNVDGSFSLSCLLPLDQFLSHPLPHPHFPNNNSEALY